MTIEYRVIEFDGQVADRFRLNSGIAGNPSERIDLRDIEAQPLIAALEELLSNSGGVEESFSLSRKHNGYYADLEKRWALPDCTVSYIADVEIPEVEKPLSIVFVPTLKVKVVFPQFYHPGTLGGRKIPSTREPEIIEDLENFYEESGFVRKEGIDVRESVKLGKNDETDYRRRWNNPGYLKELAERYQAFRDRSIPIREAGFNEIR